MLRAVEVSFAFGATPVLDAVSLECSAGTLLGIVGPNGAGKSTLLRCLAGIARPQAGRVLLDGVALESLGRRRIAQAIGFVPQGCHVAFPVTVREFVAMGRFAHERPIAGATCEDASVVQRCLLEMGIATLADRGVDELSGGEFRRVLIAQVLAQEARLLLFDEPVQQLDLRHQIEVMEFARAFTRGAERAAVVVLHDLGLAGRYCDSIALLERGRITALGTPDVVLDETRVRETWGVHSFVGRVGPTRAFQVLPLRADDRAQKTRSTEELSK